MPGKKFPEPQVADCFPPVKVVPFPSAIQSKPLARQAKIVVLGIFYHPDKGILFVKRPSGKLWLPGGTTTISRHGQREINKLGKFFFEKTSLPLKVSGLWGVYSLKRRIKPLKIFEMTFEGDPGQKNWQQKKGYEPVYLKPEQITNNRRISPALKKIVKDFLNNQRNKKTIREVQTIA